MVEKINDLIIRVHVGNLPYFIKEEDLKKEFSGYNIKDVLIVRNRFNQRFFFFFICIIWIILVHEDMDLLNLVILLIQSVHYQKKLIWKLETDMYIILF